MPAYKIHITDHNKVEFIKNLLKNMGLKEESANHFQLEVPVGFTRNSQRETQGKKAGSF